MPIKVLIADDHPLVLAGIRKTLEEMSDLEIVGEAQNGSQVLPLIARTSPDLVLLDVRMPQLDGLACLDRIRRMYPEVKVVVLSASSDRTQIAAALRHGASGYVVKNIRAGDLAAAVHQAVDGTVFNVLGVPGESAEAEDLGLTKREAAMLKALARGLSNRGIGKELWVTEQTVKFHLRNIYKKLGVSTRTEAARYAYEHGLVESTQ
jgi:two-component system nitrate/nitrite response regulator NarL